MITALLIVVYVVQLVLSWGIFIQASRFYDDVNTTDIVLFFILSLIPVASPVAAGLIWFCEWTDYRRKLIKPRVWFKKIGSEE